MVARKSKYPWYHKYIKSRIDEVWGWCPERKKAKERALQDDGRYQCESCESVVTHNRNTKGMEVDHVEPRTNVKGWDGYDSYINRTFVPATELRILCVKCHKGKSEVENKQRPHRRKSE